MLITDFFFKTTATSEIYSNYHPLAQPYALPIVPEGPSAPPGRGDQNASPCCWRRLNGGRWNEGGARQCCRLLAIPVTNSVSDMTADRARTRTFARRALLLGTAKVLLLSALAGRMYQLQVLEADRYKLQIGRA